MIRRTALLVFTVAVLAWAAVTEQAAAAPRVALVVGVSAYKNAAALPNTLNDANGVGAALKRLGFQVQTVLDPDRATLEASVRRFGDAARGAEAAVFFYAGHALEVAGRNWLLPASMQLKETRDLRFEALDVDSLLEQTDGSARVTLLFLDSCRDNPFQKRLTTGGRGIERGGMGQVSAGAGTLVAFATAPGTVASDGDGPDSPFTTALLRHIETPGLEVRQMLSLVRRDVRQATRGMQVPWENSALEGEFFFKPGVVPASQQPARAPSIDADLLFWQSVKDSTEASDFEAYLARFPSGTFSDLAKRRVAAASRASPPPGTSTVAAVAPPPAAAPFFDTLQKRVAVLAPNITRVSERLGSYLQERTHKAFAVSNEPPGTWRVSSAQTTRAAAISALESCQIRWGGACTLAAVDDGLADMDTSDWVRQVAQEVGYAGPFDPARMPIAETRRTGNDVAGYRALTGPKAMAIHPWRRIFVAGGASQREAEIAALKACNDDPVRLGKDGPCFLYATAGEVVLVQRKTVPIAEATPANPAPTPPAQSPSPSIGSTAAAQPPAVANAAVASPETQLRALFSAIGHDGGVVTSYMKLGAHRALAVQVESGRTFTWSRAASDAAAERSALEACQLRYGTPCVLFARDDTVTTTDLKTAPHRDMARVTQARAYAADDVPFALPRQAQDRANYAAAVSPKAMAIHVPKGVFWATGSTSAEAQAKAFAACNDVDSLYPCFLYAIDDRVVLAQRMTEVKR
ncbi:hypothetical protein HCU64_02995 [Methylobacterium sp. C25]|uniref:caspase family protein n=1 Tax=Methylobacterium sp. C25 TaxID=2721622 RepID=UPI001F27F2B7|nr:caspase family protein [Methylobacterium sp. C25]MCE4222706.1 hypothetical protein [Methylobacterium sp. C25]